jgi:hypothetical protein
MGFELLTSRKFKNKVQNAVPGALPHKAGNIGEAVVEVHLSEAGAAPISPSTRELWG